MITENSNETEPDLDQYKEQVIQSHLKTIQDFLQGYFRD